MTQKTLLVAAVFAVTLFFIFGSKKPTSPSTFAAFQTSSYTSQHAQLPLSDTITKLSQMRSDTAIFKKGNKFTRVIIVDVGDIDSDEIHLSRTNVSGLCNQTFSGKVRAAAKLSYAQAPYQTYSNTTALRASLQQDSIMQHSGLNSNSPRISTERRNVIIAKAYLYAFSREADGDFHCIIGDVNGTKLVNCEISALPSSTASSYKTIKSVRDYVIAFLGTDFCGKSGYMLFQPALPLTIKGSLFYDIDHKPGSVGPKGFHSPTSWEIHPVQAMSFEP